MRFDIITIFPHIFDSYLSESILKRAQKKKLIRVKIHNLRDFTKDKHKKVDDRPYGGGAGMVLMAEPILRAVANIKKSLKEKTKIILFSAKGRQFNQKMAYSWAKKLDNLILISGRYEGIDERVKKILKAEEICIGPYVLMDGDLASMIIVSALTRLLPGVIKWESLQEESFFNLLAKNEAESGKLEYPHYTRPETVVYKGKKYPVPKILLSGNHKKIEEWRRAKRDRSRA
jgi:tRNA (guanine37-N1)-methyltransferase